MNRCVRSGSVGHSRSLLQLGGVAVFSLIAFACGSDPADPSEQGGASGQTGGGEAGKAPNGGGGKAGQGGSGAGSGGHSPSDGGSSNASGSGNSAGSGPTGGNAGEAQGGAPVGGSAGSAQAGSSQAGTPSGGSAGAAQGGAGAGGSAGTAQGGAAQAGSSGSAHGGSAGSAQGGSAQGGSAGSAHAGSAQGGSAQGGSAGSAHGGSSGSAQGGGAGYAQGGSGGSGGPPATFLSWQNGYINGPSNIGNVHGYWYTVHDNGTSTILPASFATAGTSICAYGNAGQYTNGGANWGSAVGFNTNQAAGTGTAINAWNATSAGIAGFRFVLTGSQVPSSVQVNVKVAGSSASFCSKLSGVTSGTSQAVLFGSVTRDCSTNAGSHPVVDATKIEAIQLQVSSVLGSVTGFDFCVTSIQLLSN